MRRQSRSFEIHFSQIGLLASRSAWDRASIRTRYAVHVEIRSHGKGGDVAILHAEYPWDLPALLRNRPGSSVLLGKGHSFN